jgi:hypothetical protein
VNPILLDKFRCQPLPGFNDATLCWDPNLMPPAKAPPEDRATPAP